MMYYNYMYVYRWCDLDLYPIICSYFQAFIFQNNEKLPWYDQIVDGTSEVIFSNYVIVIFSTE